jgi:IS5 family transposase
VVEADIRYPADSGLAAGGIRALAREGRKLATKIAAKRTAVRDRSRAAGRRLRGITRTMRHRSGQAKEQVLKLTEQTGKLLARSVKGGAGAGSRRQAPSARRPGQTQGCPQLEQLADRCEKVVEQIQKRVNGEKTTDRLISLWDPDARPIRKGKLSQPTSSATSISSARSPPTPAGCARVHPPARQRDRQPGRGDAAAGHRSRAAEPRHQAAGVMVDGEFKPTPTNAALDGLADEVHIAGRQENGSRRTRRRRQRYRTGAEGRASHLNRGYGMRRSRLKGNEGHQICDRRTGFTYNADTYATLP